LLKNIWDYTATPTQEKASDLPVLALGLKLFSEVVLERPVNPIFAELLGSLRRFTKNLKDLPSSVEGEISLRCLPKQ
jgi:hypothetical protein